MKNYLAKFWGAAATALAISLSSQVFAQNQIIFVDEFDDGILDPAWTVTFYTNSNVTATGIDFEESIGEPSWLTVNDLFGTGFPPFNWIEVGLFRKIPPIGDFNIKMRFSWNSPPLPADVNHNMRIFVYDGDGAEIAHGGYIDNWLLATGTPNWTGCTPHINGCAEALPSSVPSVFSADFEMDRAGSLYTFKWTSSNGFSVVDSATISALDAQKLEIRIAHFDEGNTGAGGSVDFGTLAIDRISVAGTPTSPVPLISKLIDAVMALNLKAGISNSLDAKLEATLNALDDTNEQNDVAAINSLEAFINAVEAQSGKEIEDPDDALALISSAQAIIDLLNGA